MWWLWLIGCDLTRYANLPPATPTDSAPVDSTDPSGSTGSSSGRPAIVGHNLRCIDTKTWELSVSTDRATSGEASVFMMRTSAEPRGEQHHVPVLPGTGELTVHRAQLVAGVKGWTDGTSTAFDCATDDSKLVMTWVLRVDGPKGGLADCLAVGHDPQGLLSGDYKLDGVIEDPEELAACHIVPPDL